MFSLISPLTKVAALTLSLGLTWTTLGSVTTGFAEANSVARSTATHYVQLPLVVVVGQREAVLGAQATQLTKATSENTPALHPVRREAVL